MSINNQQVRWSIRVAFFSLKDSGQPSKGEWEYQQNWEMYKKNLNQYFLPDLLYRIQFMKMNIGVPETFDFSLGSLASDRFETLWITSNSRLWNAKDDEK